MFAGIADRVHKEITHLAPSSIKVCNLVMLLVLPKLGGFGAELKVSLHLEILFLETRSTSIKCLFSGQDRRSP